MFSYRRNCSHTSNIHTWSILCLSLRTTVALACIPEEDAYYRARNMCFLTCSIKKIPGLWRIKVLQCVMYPWRAQWRYSHFWDETKYREQYPKASPTHLPYTALKPNIWNHYWWFGGVPNSCMCTKTDDPKAQWRSILAWHKVKRVNSLPATKTTQQWLIIMWSIKTNKQARLLMTLQMGNKSRFF